MRPLDPNQDDELRMLAKCHGLPFLSRIESIEPNVANTMPEARTLLRYKILPLGFEQGRPRLAIADPSDWEARDAAVFLLKTPADSIDFVVCPAGEIQRAMRLFY